MIMLFQELQLSAQGRRVHQVAVQCRVPDFVSPGEDAVIGHNCRTGPSGVVEVAAPGEEGKDDAL